MDDDGLGYKDDEGEDWFGSEVLTTVGEKSSSLALDRGDVSNPGDGETCCFPLGIAFQLFDFGHNTTGGAIHDQSTKINISLRAAR